MRTMIKRSDLRSGNLFEIEGMGNYPLVDFSCDFAGKLHQVRFLSSLVFHRDRVPSETIETIIPELWQIRTIPLTEDWLARTGFSDVRGHLKYNGVRLSGEHLFWTKFDEGGRISIELPNPFGKTEIEYVHQLQNYVLILTGEELTIKEPA